MKILFFSYDIPFPLDQGGRIRAYHLIKNLALRHEITLFCFYRKEKQLKELKFLKSFCTEIRPFRRRAVNSFLNLLSLPILPFPAALYYSPRVAIDLRREVRLKPYDLVHFESFYTSMYVDDDILIPQVLGTENVEWRIYKSYAQQQSIPLLSALMKFEAWRTKKFEENSWKKTDVVLGVSRKNCREIERRAEKKAYLIPNGVDTARFKVKSSAFAQAKKSQEKTVLFIGNQVYIQNQDAARFLLREIYPRIKRKLPQTRLLIVSRKKTTEIKNLVKGKKDVILRDFEDIREAYNESGVLIVPVRAASGTRIKILEAAAAGLPVVTTKKGVEGIDAKDGREVLIRDRAAELALTTVEVLENNKLASSLAKNAEKLVREKYSWEKIVKKLEEVYQMAVGKKEAQA